MAKQYTIDTISRIRGLITFNRASLDENGTLQYYPITLRIECGSTANGVSVREEEFVTFGDPRETEFTTKELYIEMNKSFGGKTSALFKDVINNLTNEDVSL